jgi:Cytochrome c oxidase subunit III
VNATATIPVPPPVVPERTLSPGQWGMLSFLLSEVAIFGTLIVTYLFYLGKDGVGPTPAEALSLPLVLFTTACLLASSVTIHRAERLLERGDQGGFVRWWAATIVLGVVFLLGTAYEWHDLIYHHGLTISRNLFGTTYYTLVGSTTDRVRPRDSAAGDPCKPGRGWARRLVLALRGRGLGGRVHGGLLGGALMFRDASQKRTDRGQG